MVSLRLRILLAVAGIVVLTTVAVVYFVQRETERAVFRAQDAAIRNLVHVAFLNVENQNQSLLFQEKASLDLRTEIEGNVSHDLLLEVRTK